MRVPRQITQRQAVAGFAQFRANSAVAVIGPENELVSAVARAIERYGRAVPGPRRNRRAPRRRRGAAETSRPRHSEGVRSEADAPEPAAIVVNGLDLRGKTAPSKLRNWILRIREYEPDAP